MTDREIREIRINSIVPAESVLVATARSIRPREAEEPAPRDVQTHVETYPFCRGNEDKTPPELQRVPSADGQNWDIRLVSNLYPYPALGDDRENANFTFGLQQTINMTTSGPVTLEVTTGIWRSAPVGRFPLVLNWVPDCL